MGLTPHRWQEPISTKDKQHALLWLGVAVVLGMAVWLVVS